MQTIELQSVFDVSYGNKFDLNKMSRLPGGVNFVGRSSQNLGVSATVAEVSAVPPFEAGMITVALGGTKLLSAFVQPAPFYTAQNVAVLKPKVAMSFEQKIYVCLAIRHNRFRYSAFGREANRTIKVLRVPSISSAPAWLREALTSAHKDFEGRLSPLIEHIPAPYAAQPQIGESRVMVSDLFDVIYGSNLELNKLQQDPNGINFVSRTSKNNGVSAKVKEVPHIKPIDGGVLTVAGGGSVLETFLQTERFYSGRDLYYLKPREKFCIDELLFYCACIRANMFRYSYGRQANRTLKSLLVPAPEAIPAWVYGGCATTVEQIEAAINAAEHTPS
ncbi:restriction endonuclease subunit S [Novosphingobium sp. JCM 18896]|uniref:restriction endonuclease subunit S n=1 Tax=Novosphingobium sp. JCM 18896 TaxID=2989731 RepID=UPI00222385AA|nr:restriction endonuclease subunit S [Novosphingobium sp. JCM 18896]